MGLKAIIFLCPHLLGGDTEASGGGDLPTVLGMANHASQHFGSASKTNPGFLLKHSISWYPHHPHRLCKARGHCISLIWGHEIMVCCYWSVAQSCPALWPHGLQHTRPPYPSPILRACSNSCRLSRWCHPTISSPVFPFSSCLQSFPASESFPMSQLFASGGQSIGASTSEPVLPVNIQDWLALGLIDLISWDHEN